MGPSIWQHPLLKSKFVRMGLPFIITVVGGSVWLREFSQLRYTFRTKKTITHKQFEEMLGKEIPVRQVSPLKVLDEINKETDDDYQMVRGPRPWEDNTEYDEVKRKRLEEKQKKKAPAVA